MKNTSILYPIILIAIFLESCQPEEKSIKTTYKNFKTGIKLRDGELVANIVSSKTLNYYTILLKKVLDVDSSQMQNLSQSEKFMILRTRHYIPKSQILSMKDGISLLKALVENNILPNGSASNSEITDIKINNDSAIATRVTQNKKTLFRYLFEREKNAWKINTMIFCDKSTDIIWLQPALDKGMPINDYILQELEKESHHTTIKEIWEKLR